MWAADTTQSEGSESQSQCAPLQAGQGKGSGSSELAGQGGKKPRPARLCATPPAQKATWARAWSASTTGAQLCAITTSPPGLAFTRFHSSLSRHQSTLLTRLRTGACDLGAYKAHFEPERPMCACSGEPETREHLLLHCPLCASQRATLLSSLRLKSTPLAYLLSDQRVTKATLRFLTNSGRFDSLYSPPSEDPSS
ncbi:hypothetical protein C6P46_003204 [Rhodotorula mucilaginosa]|uniref:Reverse transcriptase zinc-binding domain-containing protein n=1 Tax=Rhodotorula mucilaginosa TaxID=5537 RepID=A0A9P6W509_RHOMI|nr:hypothetical protein C6P46_003204 [Rhodotorula mucilaginosa]